MGFNSEYKIETVVQHCFRTLIHRNMYSGCNRKGVILLQQNLPRLCRYMAIQLNFILPLLVTEKIPSLDQIVKKNAYISRMYLILLSDFRKGEKKSLDNTYFLTVLVLLKQIVNHLLSSFKGSVPMVCLCHGS